MTDPQPSRWRRNFLLGAAGAPLLASMHAGPDDDRARRRFWRLMLLVLAVLPFLPEIFIRLAVTAASLKGCPVDAAEACRFGPLPVGGAIYGALSAGNLVSVAFGFGGAMVWLMLCYYALNRSWRNVALRLVIALALAALYALPPFLAPYLSIGDLINPGCRPNEGGVGDCFLYGYDVDGAAHDSVTAIWLGFIGVPLAAIGFGVYLITAIAVAMHVRHGGKPVPPGGNV